jgi:hypothetical protein
MPTYDDPDKSLEAAARGVNCHGDPVFLGDALQMRKLQAWKVLFEGFNSNRFHNFDWRMVFAGLMTDQFTLNDAFFVAPGPERFWGVAYEDFLAGQKKAKLSGGEPSGNPGTGTRP